MKKVQGMDSRIAKFISTIKVKRSRLLSVEPISVNPSTRLAK